MAKIEGRERSDRICMQGDDRLGDVSFRKNGEGWSFVFVAMKECIVGGNY